MYTGIEIKDDIIKNIKEILNEKLGQFEANKKIEYFRNIGRIRQEKNKEIIRKKIDEFVSIGGVIDAESLMIEWFPEIKADIFLSHSSKDEDDVHLIVGYFKQELDLTVFVDSLVWGYSSELLKDLNNEYALSSSGYYDYNSAMWLSSNVNLMLNTALNKMIDKTECLLFFNTPNSVSSLEGDKYNGSMSNSPWIYSELSIADTIRKIIPERFSKALNSNKFNALESLDSKIEFIYKLPNTLIKLENKVLKEWLKCSNEKGLVKLNKLYNKLNLKYHSLNF